jgi:toxin ParE1/3/4
MAAYKLVISPAAREDLKVIYQYGCGAWGVRRSSQYLDRLKDQLWGLIDNPELGVKRDELVRGIRSVSVDSHVLFYRIKNRRLEVIRVLHARQDHQVNLKS